MTAELNAVFEKGTFLCVECEAMLSQAFQTLAEVSIMVIHGFSYDNIGKETLCHGYTLQYLLHSSLPNCRGRCHTKSKTDLCVCE